MLAQGEGDALADAIRGTSDQCPSVPAVSLEKVATATEEELVERAEEGEELLGEEEEADEFEGVGGFGVESGKSG